MRQQSPSPPRRDKPAVRRVADHGQSDRTALGSSLQVNAVQPGNHEQPGSQQTAHGVVFGSTAMVVPDHPTDTRPPPRPKCPQQARSLYWPAPARGRRSRSRPGPGNVARPPCRHGICPAESVRRLAIVAGRHRNALFPFALSPAVRPIPGHPPDGGGVINSTPATVCILVESAATRSPPFPDCDHPRRIARIIRNPETLPLCNHESPSALAALPERRLWRSCGGNRDGGASANPGDRPAPLT